MNEDAYQRALRQFHDCREAAMKELEREVAEDDGRWVRDYSAAMVRMQARRALKENRAKRLECWLTMGDDIRAHALGVMVEGVLNVPRRDSRGQVREIWVEGSV